MIRRIIEIDRAKCNGCGACAAACHEGAIGMRDGKAVLLRDDYCDGLGDCLPTCPTGAISFVEREAAAYDEAAVLAKKNSAAPAENAHAGGCPGAQARSIDRTSPAEQAELPADASPSELRQWPVQIQLAPIRAPFFDGADLLIAADCTAYACGDFHRRFLRGRVVLIGCPKLDEGDYTEKLCAIIRENNIRSVTIVRMEVPCCGGIERAATAALQASGKFLPWRTVIVSTDGRIRE